MQANDYQAKAMRTASIPAERKQERLYHAIFGLCSEAGEAAGILQKTFQGHDFDATHLASELGDCLWMIAEACDALQISLDAVMMQNIIKLYKRYPEGFDSNRSLHRQDGDI